MFEFFIENNLIPKNQSGFRRGDSCINQLLSITHDILSKSPPLGQHKEQEIILTTFLGSMSNVLFLRTRSLHPL